MAVEVVKIDYVANSVAFERGTRRAQESLRGLQSQITGTISALKAFAGAAVAAFSVSRISQSLLAAVNRVDELADAAQRLGATVKSLQAIRAAARGVDIDASQLDVALTKLLDTIDAAEQGSADATKALDRLGLKSWELANIPLGEQLEKIATALQKIKSESAKVAILRDMFGRGGAAVGSLLADPRFLEKATDQLRSVGALLDDHVVKNLKRADDAVNQLKNGWDAWVAKAASGLVAINDRLVEMQVRLIGSTVDTAASSNATTARWALGIPSAGLIERQSGGLVRRRGGARMPVRGSGGGATGAGWTGLIGAIQQARAPGRNIGSAIWSGINRMIWGATAPGVGARLGQAVAGIGTPFAIGNLLQRRDAILRNVPTRDILSQNLRGAVGASGFNRFGSFMGVTRVSRGVDQQQLDELKQINNEIANLRRELPGRLGLRA